MKHQTAIQARPLPNRLADRGRALLRGLLAALLATALLSQVGCEGASFDVGGGVGGSGLVWGPMGDEPSCDDLLVDQVCFDSSIAVVTINV